LIREGEDISGQQLLTKPQPNQAEAPLDCRQVVPRGGNHTGERGKQRKRGVAGGKQARILFRAGHQDASLKVRKRETKRGP